MSAAHREDAYRLAALLRDVERLLRPLPVRDGGAYRIPPPIPGPLPPTGAVQPTGARSATEWAPEAPVPVRRREISAPWVEPAPSTVERSTPARPQPGTVADTVHARPDSPGRAEAAGAQPDQPSTVDPHAPATNSPATPTAVTGTPAKLRPLAGDPGMPAAATEAAELGGASTGFDDPPARAPLAAGDEPVARRMAPQRPTEPAPMSPDDATARPGWEPSATPDSHERPGAPRDPVAPPQPSTMVIGPMLAAAPTERPAPRAGPVDAPLTHRDTTGHECRRFPAASPEGLPPTQPVASPATIPAGPLDAADPPSRRTPAPSTPDPRHPPDAHPEPEPLSANGFARQTGPAAARRRPAGARLDALPPNAGSTAEPSHANGRPAATRAASAERPAHSAEPPSKGTDASSTGAKNVHTNGTDSHGTGDIDGSGTETGTDTGTDTDGADTDGMDADNVDANNIDADDEPARADRRPRRGATNRRGAAGRLPTLPRRLG